MQEPVLEAALEVPDVPEALLPQHPDRSPAAKPEQAADDDLLVPMRFEGVNPAGEGAVRDPDALREGIDPVFPFFPHVHEDGLFSRLQLLVQINDGDPESGASPGAGGTGNRHR
jgi:hypothetical protein